MLNGMSNSLMDSDGSHILLDQVILISLNIILKALQMNISIFTFAAVSICRCFDHPHVGGLQIL